MEADMTTRTDAEGLLREAVEAAHPEPRIKDDSRGESTFWRGIHVGRDQVYAALPATPPDTDPLRVAEEMFGWSGPPDTNPSGLDPNMDYERRDAMLDVVRRQYGTDPSGLDVETALAGLPPEPTYKDSSRGEDYFWRGRIAGRQEVLRAIQESRAGGGLDRDTLIAALVAWKRVDQPDKPRQVVKRWAPEFADHILAAYAKETDP